MNINMECSCLFKNVAWSRKGGYTGLDFELVTIIDYLQLIISKTLIFL